MPSVIKKEKKRKKKQNHKGKKRKTMLIVIAWEGGGGGQQPMRGVKKRKKQQTMRSPRGENRSVRRQERKKKKKVPTGSQGGGGVSPSSLCRERGKKTGYRDYERRGCDECLFFYLQQKKGRTRGDFQKHIYSKRSGVGVVAGEGRAAPITFEFLLLREGGGKKRKKKSSRTLPLQGKGVFVAKLPPLLQGKREGEKKGGEKRFKERKRGWAIIIYAHRGTNFWKGEPAAPPFYQGKGEEKRWGGECESF